MKFQLNERLAKGGFDLGTHGICRVLLKNNSHFSWFILVPEIDTEITEVHQLSDEQYVSINQTTRIVAKFISKHFSPEKINIGNIGNVVRQMHIHVIGRTTTDPAWPGVVWASSEKQTYKPASALEIHSAYTKFLKNF